MKVVVVIVVVGVMFVDYTDYYVFIFYKRSSKKEIVLLKFIRYLALI